MPFLAYPPYLHACQTTLAEQLEGFVSRLGSMEIQALLASIKECGPNMLFDLFVTTLEDPPERNLDTVLVEIETQFQGLKRMLLVDQKPSEVTPPPSPPESPKEARPMIIDGLPLDKPTFNTVQHHLSDERSFRFSLDSEIPLNTRMLLILLRDGCLTDAGLFDCRVAQRMRDILAKFRVQYHTDEQLSFAISPSAMADYICFVETQGPNVAPNPAPERLPIEFVPIQISPPPRRPVKRRATENLELEGWGLKRRKMQHFSDDDVNMI